MGSILDLFTWDSEDQGYVAGRIANTYVKHTETSFAFNVEYVRFDDLTAKGFLYDPNGLPEEVDSMPLKDLDPFDMPLGFGWNRFYETTYLFCRKLIRQDWRQGLRENNTQSTTPDGQNANLNPTALSYCFVGKYPKVDEAWLLDRPKPLSRNFMLTSKGLLRYRLQTVGRYEADKMYLNEEFEFLYETFKEEVDYDIHI